MNASVMQQKTRLHVLFSLTGSLVVRSEALMIQQVLRGPKEDSSVQEALVIQRWRLCGLIWRPLRAYIVHRVLVAQKGGVCGLT